VAGQKPRAFPALLRFRVKKHDAIIALQSDSVQGIGLGADLFRFPMAQVICQLLLRRRLVAGEVVMSLSVLK
jgi:hypothetical protein